MIIRNFYQQDSTKNKVSLKEYNFTVRGCFFVAYLSFFLDHFWHFFQIQWCQSLTLLTSTEQEIALSPKTQFMNLIFKVSKTITLLSFSGFSLRQSLLVLPFLLLLTGTSSVFLHPFALILYISTKQTTYRVA